MQEDRIMGKSIIFTEGMGAPVQTEPQPARAFDGIADSSLLLQNAFTSLFEQEISHIKITISDNEPYSFLIGINTSGGIKEVKIYPKKYYFFKNEKIQSVENIDDVVFWD